MAVGLAAVGMAAVLGVVTMGTRDGGSDARVQAAGEEAATRQPPPTYDLSGVDPATAKLIEAVHGRARPELVEWLFAEELGLHEQEPAYDLAALFRAGTDPASPGGRALVERELPFEPPIEGTDEERARAQQLIEEALAAQMAWVSAWATDVEHLPRDEQVRRFASSLIEHEDLALEAMRTSTEADVYLDSLRPERS